MKFKYLLFTAFLIVLSSCNQSKDSEKVEGIAFRTFQQYNNNQQEKLKKLWQNKEYDSAIIVSKNILKKFQDVNTNEQLRNIKTVIDATYNLSCIYSLNNELDSSYVYLKKAIINGYTNTNWLRKDGDLENLRSSPNFNKLLKLSEEKKNEVQNNYNNTQAPGTFVDMNGYKLHYISKGEETSMPTVVFIHGGGDSALVWTLVQDSISDITKTIAIDSHGRGWSDFGKTPRTYKQIAFDFYELLKKEGIRGPYILVPHSIGGLITLEFIKQFKNDVAGILMVDTTPLDRIGRYTDEAGNSYVNLDRLEAKDIQVPLINDEEYLQNEMEVITRSNDFSHYSELTLHQLNLLNASVCRSRYVPVDSEYAPYYSEQLNELYNYSEKLSIDENPLTLILSKPNSYERYPNSWFSIISKKEASEISIKSQLEYLNLSNNSKLIETENGHHIQLENPRLLIEELRLLLSGF